MSSQQPSQNVSWALNNLGPWADPLIAGIGGSAASLNFLEPLASALPVIKNNPGAYGVPYLLAAQSGAQQPADSNQANQTGTAGQSSTQGAADAGVAIDIFNRIRQILKDQGAGSNFGIDKAADAVKKPFEVYFKNTVIVVLGMILITFGLWILLYPTMKPIIVSAAKDAAKAAA